MIRQLKHDSMEARLYTLCLVQNSIHKKFKQNEACQQEKNVLQRLPFTDKMRLKSYLVEIKAISMPIILLMICTILL